MTYQLGQTVSLTPMRKTIASRLRMSMDTAVQANHRLRVDMSAILAARAIFKRENKPITVGDMIQKCVVETIVEYPLVNSTLEGNKINIHEDVNLGVAVATEWGLVVPVVQAAQKRSLAEISDAIRALAEKARTRKLTMDEMTGGTFTVSNLGMLGIESFTAVINPPEAAILAVGACVNTVIPKDGMFAVAPLCEFSLTYDHRILDGEPAARFLVALKAKIESFAVR